jgi:DNA helicase-2/ATP-dependent DNA helicase PcrA
VEAPRSAVPPAAPTGQSRLGFGGSTPAPAKKAKGFRNGARIVHPKYGRGTIMRVEGEGDDAKLTISFVSGGLKKLVAKYAGIESD